MQRVCFRLRLRPELIEEYVELHRAVWPDMLRAIERSGRRNYSIFLNRAMCELVGYYETDDDAAAAAFLAADPIATSWERQSSRFFVGLAGRPDQNAEILEEVFQLEDQLAAIRAS